MFDNKSRYNDCEDAVITIVSDITNTVYGNKVINTKEIKYKKRRVLPIVDTDYNSDNIPTLQEVTIKAGDRLDNISAATLGDPEQFWQICDYNNAMYPPDLTFELGKTLVVKAPWT